MLTTSRNFYASHQRNYQPIPITDLRTCLLTEANLKNRDSDNFGKFIKVKQVEVVCLSKSKAVKTIFSLAIPQYPQTALIDNGDKYFVKSVKLTVNITYKFALYQFLLTSSPFISSSIFIDKKEPSVTSEDSLLAIR